MWSSVGSVGVMNNTDAGKVVFIGSIAQLGVGIGGATTGSVGPRIEERIGLPTVTATLRYPVQGTDLGNQAPGVWNLTVRYRDGNGSVTVHIIQVAADTGEERAVATLQSGVGFNRSNSFHNEISQGTFGTDFERNTYYVAVVLTGPAIELGVPPAIQLMQIGQIF
jgi:hypothetical protein